MRMKGAAWLAGDRNPENSFQRLLDIHRELERDKRTVDGQLNELLDIHRELERDKRASDDRVRELLEKDEVSELRSAFRKASFFCVHGAVIEAPYPPVSPQIQNALAEEGYESVELYLGSQLIRRSDAVLDLGSGLGLSAIVAGMAANEGSVTGLEADPRVADLAQRNANRNVKNVTIRNSAVSVESGVFKFFQAPDFLANSLFPLEGATEISVPCVAFADLIAELQPDVITCDVEGVERNLFEGVDISCVRSIVLETHPVHIGDDGVQKCIADLAEAGLRKIDHLCWGPVLVFSRDKQDQYIEPFRIKPRGKKKNQYVAPFHLHNLPDVEIIRDIDSYRQSNSVHQGSTFVWYSPNWLYWWGGGIYTILRFAKFIADKGVKTIIYVYDNRGYPSLEKLRSDLDEAFPGHSITLTTSISELPEGHVAIATTHQSVFSVLRAPPCSARFYLMQEYESLLYTGGTQAEQANATYQLGFKGICGGDWLRSIFMSYGGKAIKFEFSVDRSVFYPSRPISDEIKRLFFFGRPTSDRRMYDLGVAVLQAIHEKYPHIEIIIAGLDDLPELPFPATYLGNLMIEETADLYRTCDIGLTFSGSNLSYLPLELMASGVPVLTNRGPQVSWFCKHLENAYCAYPFVSAFLDGFTQLVESKALRERLVRGGQESVVATSWASEADKIYAFISAEIGWDGSQR
ncbi:hypothetical protein CWS72_07365 [Telmatospirillum siberiense]|uniref:Methyltransferase FkbM domain-containing protein n=2 Tax=Telmatospirillum siberiense TaxID=382514 RepID=A0A2N3PYB7_9PROT|nr:hypothetical protein CWS72_07365 [Telmatospirillum siberiense]